MTKRDVNNIFLGSCPVCRKKLNDRYLNVIEKQESAVLCCAECAYCRSSIIFSVSYIQNNIITTIGMLTDIQMEDMGVIREGKNISADDVLAIHQFFKEKHYEDKSDKKRNKR